MQQAEDGEDQSPKVRRTRTLAALAALGPASAKALAQTLSARGPPGRGDVSARHRAAEVLAVLGPCSAPHAGRALVSALSDADSRIARPAAHAARRTMQADAKAASGYDFTAELFFEPKTHGSALRVCATRVLRPHKVP
mmetsp:Transcript_64747/g.192928  ORF Transcript_64747/g.192928 Transcript_64747/m.192928 type:complete len:139 (+) Transcript_64747:279-695(+)